MALLSVTHKFAFVTENNKYSKSCPVWNAIRWISVWKWSICPVEIEPLPWISAQKSETHPNSLEVLSMLSIGLQISRNPSLQQNFDLSSPHPSLLYAQPPKWCMAISLKSQHVIKMFKLGSRAVLAQKGKAYRPKGVQEMIGTWNNHACFVRELYKRSESEVESRNVKKQFLGQLLSHQKPWWTLGWGPPEGHQRNDWIYILNLREGITVGFRSKPRRFP